MLVTPMQMQALEKFTDASGISYGAQMDIAGRMLANVIRERYPDVTRVLLLAGPGNNGGDCYAAAYHMQQAGMRPEIVAPLGDPEIASLAETARDRAKRCGIPIYTDAYDFILQDIPLVVDGLFGTGFHGALPDRVRPLLASIKANSKRIVACDVPSGGDALTGLADADALAADMTVTFGAEKLGMSQYPLRALCGEVVVADIGIPREAFSSLPEPPAEKLSLETVKQKLPVFAPDAHKYTRGHLLAIVGCPAMRGAAVLATEAAMRCGAGLVTCASCEPVLNAVMDRVPEVLCAPFPSDEFGDMDYTGIEAGLEGKRAVLYGCGSGTPNGIGAAFFQGHAGQQDLTYILDASGLNYLADHIEWIPKGRTILTPHPGEAARLLGTDVDTVQADRPAAARRIAEMTGTVVVLKGAGTIITDGKRTAVCCDGNNGMAKAGSGDVLAGIISALAAQGMEPYDAACAGVMLHAAAGDLAAEELGQRYMLPQDLIVALQEVL